MNTADHETTAAASRHSRAHTIRWIAAAAAPLILAGVSIAAASPAGAATHKVTHKVTHKTTHKTLVRAADDGEGEGPTPAIVTINPSLNPSPAGQTLTFTATVSGDGGGTVGFLDGETALPGCIAIHLTPSGDTNVAQCTVPDGFAEGSYIITASYTGDASFGSGSATFTEVIGEGTGTGTTPPFSPVTHLAVTPVVLSLSPLGLELFKLGAVLTDSNGVPLAGRTVNFTAGTNELCSAVTDSTGTASCSILLQLGPMLDTIVSFGDVATFFGDETYSGSTGSAALLTL